MSFTRDVAIIGGCGHVGLPLGLAFADRGMDVVLHDIDPVAVQKVNDGVMPFAEEGAQEVLQRVIGSRLTATLDPKEVSSAENVIVVIGTPVDGYLNPDPAEVPRALKDFSGLLTDGQLIVLRSTVYPGVTALIERLVQEAGLRVDVSFCPERIAEGKAMTELYELPQIISGRGPKAMDRAQKLFRNLTSQTVELLPEEAELAKLFTNTWRYAKFAIANQLYMMANDFGLDFERIRAAVTHDYPRAADIPRAGFAAGPCLLKDTMQLAAFNNNNFSLGHASMTINEGLPMYLVSKLEQKHNLANMTVGILGMAFKAESDDVRSSLSYKLKRILRFKARHVLTTDPYVTVDPETVPLEDVLARSDLLILGAPHKVYSTLKPDVPILDIWGLLGRGVKA